MTSYERRNTMDVRLVINPDLCIGYGECVAEDPAAVTLGEDGCAHALVHLISAERAQRICAVCPTGAMSTADAADAA
jgi:ferredoxin